jgi:hypothetical protein
MGWGTGEGAHVWSNWQKRPRNSVPRDGQHFNRQHRTLVLTLFRMPSHANEQFY